MQSLQENVSCDTDAVDCQGDQTSQQMDNFLDASNEELDEELAAKKEKKSSTSTSISNEKKKLGFNKDATMIEA